MRPVLIEPSARYQESYLQAVAELDETGESTFYIINRDYLRFAGFAKYLEGFRALNDHSMLQPGTNPETCLWMIDDDIFIGHIYFFQWANENDNYGQIEYVIRPSKRRQGYGKAILRLGLEELRQLGASRVLITCNENNTASKKIIEANGGVFINQISPDGSDDAIPENFSTQARVRYWIYL